MNQVVVFGFSFNLPLEFFFEASLAAEILRHKPKTVATRRSQLLGLGAKLNWVMVFNCCGIYATQMTVYDLAAAKTWMKNECNKLHLEYAHYDSALNAALKWGIALNIIPLTKYDLSVIKQNRKIPAEIEYAPEELVAILQTKRLGMTDFLHIRNYCLIVISLIYVGLRTGKEVLSQKEGHLHEWNLSATVIRECGDKVTLPYRRDHFDCLMQLVALNGEVRRQYLQSGGIPAEGMEDLFINPVPKKRGGKLTWAMSNEDIQNVLKEICETYGLEYIAPSIFRRNSCIYGQTAALCVGFHESYVSNTKGHSSDTEEDSYARTLGSEIEFIDRHPRQNIEFLERIFSHSIHEWHEKPNEVRHLACAFTSLQSLGRFEMREKVARYRAGELDLDRFPMQPVCGTGEGFGGKQLGEWFVNALLRSMFR